MNAGRYSVLVGVCAAAALVGGVLGGRLLTPDLIRPGQVMPYAEAYHRIQAVVDTTRVISTHQHGLTEPAWLSREVKKYRWVSSPMTRYSRSPIKRIAALDLFGIPDLTDASWPLLKERVEAAKRPGQYEYIIRDRARIDLCLVDNLKGADPRGLTDQPGWWVQVQRFDHFVELDRPGLAEIAARYDMTIQTLDDLLTTLDKAFQDIIARDFVGLKCALAYQRILRFEDVSRDAAEGVFRRLLRGDLSPEARRPLEDYMMRQIVRRAGEYGLPYQIHTGLQAGRGRNVADSNPTHLINLFQQYPDTQFDLFHGGYPFMGESGALAKQFPNVYLDMNAMQMVSPTTSRLWLHQWLELLPIDKILYFGADGPGVYGTYGHMVQARRILTEVLAEKIARGDLTVDDAAFIAFRLLRQNAIDLFQLDRFLQG